MDSAIGPVRTFAFVAAALVVFAHLLPEAVAEIGFPALVVFAASLALPAALERLAHAGHGQAHRHGEHADDHAPGLEIGYLGLLLHNFGDGLAIGALGGPHGTAWERNQVALSVAAHTIPITAIFVVAFAAQRSTRAALVRACLLGLAIAAGMAVATLIPESTTRPWEPWITAAIAGVLMHVIAHDWPADPAPDGLSRALDLAAIGAALGLALLPMDPDAITHAAAEVPSRLATSLLRLAAGIALPLLGGLVAGAALQTALDGRRAGFGRAASRGRSPLGEAARGVAFAAAQPGSAPRAIDETERLREEGATPAFAVAFLAAARGAGIETFLVGATLLGLRWALARAIGTALVAHAAGRAIAAVAVAASASGEQHPDEGGATVSAHGSPAREAETDGGAAARFLAHLDELVTHVGAWTIVGLLVASYVELALPADGFDRSPGSVAFAWLSVVAAFAGWMGAVAATPLAAVLVHAGWSRSAALAALVLGPTLGPAGWRWVRDRFGAAAVIAASLAMFACALPWSLAAGSAGLLTRSADPIADRLPGGGAALVAPLTLAGLLVRSIWRSGLRNWLGRLGEAPGAAGAHPDDHPAHGYHPAHGHDHGKAPRPDLAGTRAGGAGRGLPRA